MALVKVRRGDQDQITLPDEVREALRVAEGDYLDVEVIENGVLLRPVAVADRDAAWQRVLDAPESVRYLGPEPRPSPEEEEQMIFEMVEAFRHGRD